MRSSSLSARLHSTSNEFKQALTSEVGLTKQEMAKRAAELERQQKLADAKLSSEQKQQGQQISCGEYRSQRSEDGVGWYQNRGPEDPG